MATADEAVATVKELLSLLTPSQASIGLALSDGQRLRQAADEADRRDDILMRARRLVREHNA